MMVMEAYPDLKANQNMIALQEELTSTENKVAFARQAYNDAVTQYNTRREQFPAVLLADTFGFRTAELFEVERAEERYEEMEGIVGSDNMRRVENWILLEAIDYHWREHLTAVEELRQSIGLQAYAQVDPPVAFKREGYDMVL